MFHCTYAAQDLKMHNVTWIFMQGTPHVKNFSKPLTLCKLARFLRDSWIVMVGTHPTFCITHDYHMLLFFNPHRAKNLEIWPSYCQHPWMGRKVGMMRFIIHVQWWYPTLISAHLKGVGGPNLPCSLEGCLCIIWKLKVLILPHNIITN